MARLPAKKKPKKAYHHGDLRRAFLDAALTVLESQGAHALTMREVAKRVGVTPAAPYHHFADKEAILAAIGEEGFVFLHDAMVAARDAAGTKSTARLRAMGQAYVRFAVAHPAHFRVMFVQMCDVPKYPALHAAADKALGVLVEGVMASQQAGAARRGDPLQLSMLAWSMTHGLSMLWIEGAMQGHEPGAPALDINALTEAATDLLVRGLAK